MQRCLELAVLGAGSVAPNPMVGAVLVHDGRVIGEGYHRQYGEAHAEVNCINSALKENAQHISESTLYVSLEPCAHFGKTPPCSDLIIEKKIPNVVIGCTDSFVAVNGRGIEKLKAGGVHVIVGVLEKEAVQLNKRFFTFHQKQRPYIILKWAQSNDGKIAGNDAARVLITNEFTNRLVHKWRSKEASILVGTNTALRDDPELTTRLWPGNNPVRMLIDKELISPPHLKFYDQSAKTIVFNYCKEQEVDMVSYVKLERGRNIIPQVLHSLYRHVLQSVIVEGGAKLLHSFIDEGLWDEARVITNSGLNIGEGLAAPVLINNALTSEQVIENDVVSYFTNIKS